MDLLAHLRTFVGVVEAGSLSGAARATGQSLAAVSRQLSALEAELGASLVVRSTRRLHVTEAGRELQKRADAILQSVDDARDAIGGEEEVRGAVVVSASITYGLERVAPVLDALALAHPALVVHLRLEDHAVDLLAEGVDVAVRAGMTPPDSHAFVAHALEQTRRILVAAPRCLRRHGRPRTLEALASLPALVQVLPSGRVLPWSLHEGDAPLRELRPRPAFTCNAPIVLREACVAGRGVAFLPDWVVEDALAAGALEPVLPTWRSPVVSTWAVHRAELRGSRKVRAVVDALRRGARAAPTPPTTGGRRTAVRAEKPAGARRR